MKNILVSILFITSFTFANFLFSNEIDIKDRLATQNFLKSAYPIVFGKKIYHQTSHPRTDEDIERENELGIHKEFLTKVKKVSSTNPKFEKNIIALTKGLDNLLPQNILRPLIYWKLIYPNSENVEKVISYFMLYKINILRDHIDNPLSTDQESAQALLEQFCEKDVSTQNIFKKCSPGIFTFSKQTSKTNDIEAFVDELASNEIIKLNFRDYVKSINPYSLSYLGIIPGNQVEVISYNDTSKERMQWVNERFMFGPGSIFDFNKEYVQMPTEKNPHNGHIVFKKNGDPIFKRIREMIDRAKESIFIDIFLFGGTMGMTLSEYLLDETIKKINANPNFKLIILHDYATNYNLLEELMPVFKYIRDRLDNEDIFNGRAFLIQSNIFRHPPGIPFGITNLIIDQIKSKHGAEFDQAFKGLEKRNTYIESKIDHSKVIVIDPNSDAPEAYFGSKNWTDHSGAYYYDNAIYVRGPAAALVQASYYDDIDAALTTDEMEKRWFYYKNRDEGSYSNEKHAKYRNEILKQFVISREPPYPIQKNNQPLRIAEGNVDGTIKDARNILIDMIRNATKNIYMEQLFIYDPYVNDALIKRKKQIPSLDIRIVADHNGNFGLGGLPNTLFIKEMKSYGIDIRARRTIGTELIFKDGTKKEFHQENHRKITSVDGIVLLGGSSNLNPDTLQGSFREFGAQIFDREQIRIFDKKFTQDWDDPKEIEDIDIESFQMKVGQKTFSTKLSALVNALGSAILRNKDRLERRY